MSERGALKKATQSHVPPAGTSAYAPNPHLGRQVDDLHSVGEQTFLNWLKRVGTRQPNQVWVCGQHTYFEIGDALRVHWTTVRRWVISLKAKFSIQTREVWSCDRRGGRRLGTLYSIPPFIETLERRRAIPDAAVTPEGHLLYIGRGRRIVTRAVALEWGIDLASFAVTAKQKPFASAEPEAGAARSEARRPGAPPKGPPRAMPSDPDVSIVLAELVEVCPATAADAADVLAIARNVEPSIAAGTVIEMLKAILARKLEFESKKGVHRPLVPGWFRDRMPAEVGHWQARRRKEERRAAKEAQYMRDQRINGLADILMTSPERRDPEVEEYLATADPGERAEAERLIAQRPLRSAGGR